MSPELLEGAIGFNKDTFLSKQKFKESKRKSELMLNYILNQGIDVYACALVLWEVISRGDFYGEKIFSLKRLT